jgi:imidazolonepropionase-like amidohydrolase
MRRLNEAFAFVDGAADKLPEPAAQGVNIGFRIRADRPAGKLAFVGARIVTMKGDEVIDDGALVTDGNRIVAVGPRSQVAIPPDAMVYEVGGATIIPGLVDVHAHGPQATNGIQPQRNWLHFAQLAFGVTTTHDPSNDTDAIFGAAELARAGKIVAPRIFSTGTILYGADSAYRAIVDSKDDALSHLRRLHAVGAFSVNSYNQPRRDQRQQVIAAARELGMMVVPEGGSLYQHNMSMVVDGHTGVEHALPVARIYRDVTQLWGATAVGYTPTLVVANGGLSGEVYWYAATRVWENERLLRFVPRESVDPVARRRIIAPEGDWNHLRAAEVARTLANAGVRVNIGAHGQREGLAAHWEIWSLVDGGMTPLQALRAATANGAHYLGMDRDIGSLEPGKLADFAVIAGNPMVDIRSTEKVQYTVVNGRIFDAATMNELGHRPRARGSMFWEHDVVP